MATWIFQANPDKFDLEGYLNANLGTISWVVRQHREEVSVGDTVFIWRSVGKERDLSGVVAECRVASSVEERGEEPNALLFWKGELPKVEDRVQLIVLRVANARQILKRDWLTSDPILRDLLLFRQAQGTNYKLTEDAADRLKLLWARTGLDWSWRDSVAGLWAYEQTRGKEVSKVPGSPVALVAIATGRAVSGVYNKVMNFRALDPTDERKGFEGGSDTDRQVWKGFFDPSVGRIQGHILDDEVKRLGLEFGGGAILPSISSGGASGPIETLMKKYEAAKASGVFPLRPPAVVALTQTFARNPLVVSIARLRASSKCEVPGCSTPTFKNATGEDFCEIHHIVPLSEGGEDVIENAICLCPVHHREAHHGMRRADLRAAMQQARRGPR